MNFVRLTDWGNGQLVHVNMDHVSTIAIIVSRQDCTRLTFVGPALDTSGVIPYLDVVETPEQILAMANHCGLELIS